MAISTKDTIFPALPSLKTDGFLWDSSARATLGSFSLSKYGTAAAKANTRRKRAALETDGSFMIGSDGLVGRSTQSDCGGMSSLEEIIKNAVQNCVHLLLGRM